MVKLTVQTISQTLLLVSSLYQAALTVKPTIISETGEILRNEGDTLEVVCSSSEKVYFSYPVDVGNAITTSKVEQEEYDEDGVRMYVLRRPKTIHGDTGWYGCSDREIQLTPNVYNDSNINWVYVYVRSNTSAFVQSDAFESIRKITGGTVIIPCRPTSPDLKVRLLYDFEDWELGEKVSFDPRFGFTLRNLTLRDSGYLKCSIKWDDSDQEVNYHLLVLRKQILKQPEIDEEAVRHVIRGQTLYVNCTIDVEADMQYVLNWSTPQQNARITTRQYRLHHDQNQLVAVCELTITNVMDEDEGEYVCSITTYQESKRTKKYITVHDPDIKYINLTAQQTNKHFERKDGDKVQYLVYVDAFPPVNLKWLNPKGEEIVASWKDPVTSKYAINTTSSSTMLRINRLNIKDMGMYSLQAINEDRIEMLNFTLDVLAKPIALLHTAESYYMPNQLAEIVCHVAAFPPPNITWNFLQCPNFPSYENSSVVHLRNVTEITDMTSFISKVNMTIKMSGHINCTACNPLGCDSVTETIFVSDVSGGFGIIEPKRLVAEGDDVDIICAVSVYNYSNVIEWLDSQERPIEETDRLKIVEGRTQFTYRSTLKLSKVRKSDEGYYTCSVKTNSLGFERMEYNLKIHEPSPPILIDTNLNTTDLSVDLGTEGHKTIILKCFAYGMPEPNVTWYKDGAVLMRNEQYFFLHKHQELHIRYLLEKDSGKYSCSAENRLGKLEAYQNITIKGKELPKGLIILIVLLIIVVVILSVYFTIKVRRERIMRKELMEAGLMHFEEGALECLNPDLTVDDQAELLPYDKKWEFPRERLKLGKQLGSGAFGVVMKAEAQGICEDEAVTTVAVKMVRRTTDPTYVRALASELKIMVHLGKHLNVVNLLGACTKNITKRELLVIVEYCRFGNLHNYLLRHRANFINQLDPTTGKYDPTIGSDLLTRTMSISSNNSLSANSASDSVRYIPDSSMDSQGVIMSPDGFILSNNSSQPGWRSNYRGDYKDYNLKPICTQDLLSWAFQVARGMEYLSQRRVLHGDLAARNILLAENNVVKICDFGLAKTMYKDDNYKKKGDGPLPIKWMAIESIRDRVFSTQSDIWSFGIVLWEFFTLAETPYPGMEAEKQYQKLIEGYRMEQPEYATKEVYDIMLQCWKAKPTLRPSFTELVESIGDLLEESVRAHYISLNTPYVDMNTMNMESGKNDYLTMMSAPDHAALSSPTHEYVNSPALENGGDSAYLCMSPTSQRDESGIFSPRPNQEKIRFEFPPPTSDSEDAVELSPMLKKEEEDPYLKPINVQERRAEFARQRQTMKNQAIDRPVDRDSGYCNTPQNLHLIDLNDKQLAKGEQEQLETVKFTPKEKDFVPSIIRTQDNYVNMPQQKSDLKKDLPDSYSNPSYVIMNNKELNQMKV